MGGPGSGSWVRTNTKRGTDSLPRLSVSDLGNAVGLKHPGNVGRLSWTFKGDEVVAYRATYDGESVHLLCESGTQQQFIRFTSTTCNFGGKRCWFLCPDCDRRVGVFYLVTDWWTCRVCGRIRYSSQQETPAARLARRLRKIRSQLSASPTLLEPPGAKPKPRVDVSLDFGQTWQATALQKPANRLAWQHWEKSVDFPSQGYYEIWARATDSAGKSQPMVLPGWNPRGYLNNACHRIAVKVV